MYIYLLFQTKKNIEKTNPVQIRSCARRETEAFSLSLSMIFSKYYIFTAYIYFESTIAYKKNMNDSKFLLLFLFINCKYLVGLFFFFLVLISISKR